MKIAGIDAVMIYADDPQSLSTWYRDVLGIVTEKAEDGNFYGDVEDADGGKVIHFGIYPAEGANGSSTGRVMINYRVASFQGALEALEQHGVSVESTLEEEYGRFAYVRDPEGNPIEIWAEPEPSSG